MANRRVFRKVPRSTRLVIFVGCLCYVISLTHAENCPSGSTCDDPIDTQNLDECLAQTGASKEDVYAAANCGPVDNEKVIEAEFCLMKKRGLINEDGIVNKEAWREVNRKATEKCRRYEEEANRTDSALNETQQDFCDDQEALNILTDMCLDKLNQNTEGNQGEILKQCVCEGYQGYDVYDYFETSENDTQFDAEYGDSEGTGMNMDMEMDVATGEDMMG